MSAYLIHSNKNHLSQSPTLRKITETPFWANRKSKEREQGVALGVRDVCLLRSSCWPPLCPPRRSRVAFSTTLATRASAVPVAVLFSGSGQNTQLQKDRQGLRLPEAILD